MLKNITINKRKEVKAATHPTHDLVASDEKYENKTIIGAMWTRTAKDSEGTDYKFLSGTLSKPRTHEGKEYDGYVIITEKEWNEYQNLKGTNQKAVEVGGYNGEVTNVNEIDF
jgi:hypothetical protein